MVKSGILEEVTVRILRTAVTTLPPDVRSALQRAREEETSPVARSQLDTILENVALAEKKGIPMCQDTGISLFYVTGQCHHWMEEEIRRGVARATEEIPLRPNVVHPITRENSGNNLGTMLPHIVFEPTDHRFTEITVLTKGAGSENMSSLAMLTPSQGLKGIKDFVLDTVVRAGGGPCPPTIVGVGIGGSADIASALAKRATLRPLNDRSEETEALEREMTSLLNDTGIGPMGLGGRTTVLGVKVEMASCHTASLPVAVNLQCWASRRSSARIHPDGRVQFSQAGFP